MYELKTHLLDLLRNRPGCLNRRRHSDKIVWLVRAISPTAYERERDEVFAGADDANARAQEYADELNNQRKQGTPDLDEIKSWAKLFGELQKLRDMVQPGELPPGRDGREADTDGKRKTAGRPGADMRDVDSREARPIAQARRENCQSEECPDRTDGPGCLGRQRAGMCAAL